jgi:putative peptidoglycan lipid II flippase
VAPSPPNSSLRSVSLVTSLTFLQLLLQFATQLVLAKFFGAAGEMDAFVAALAPPITLATMLSASLGYVLVPVVAEQIAAKNDRGAATVASQIGLYLLAVSLALTLIAVAAAQPLTGLLFPGFSSEQLSLTTSLWRILSLLIVANSLIAYLNALFHCFQRFARPALAGVFGTLVTLAYVVLLHHRQGIHSVAWGVVIGAAATIAILFPFFANQLWRSTAWMQPIHAGSRRCLWLILPLLLASLYWRLDPLLDRFLGSYLPSGNIAHMGYAWRLISGLMLIGTSGLSIVAFPAIAAHAAASRKTELNAELAHAICFFLFLIIPVCVGLATFAHPVVRLLFEHGKFTSTDTRAVSLLVILYVGVIFGAGLGDLLSRTFYSLQDMLTPVIVSTLTFTLAAALKFAFVSRYAVSGLVFPTSLFYLLNSVLLAAILLRRLSPHILAGVPATLLRSLTSSAIACLVAYLILFWPHPLAVLPAAAAGAATYIVVMLLLNDPFATKIFHWLTGK